MKRTVAFSPQEGPDEKTMTAKGQDENMTTPDTKNKTAIVASLPVDRSRPINPYSSLTLSPKGHHALVAGKGTIQLVSMDPNGLGLLKSLKIALVIFFSYVNSRSFLAGQHRHASRTLLSDLSTTSTIIFFVNQLDHASIYIYISIILLIIFNNVLKKHQYVHQIQSSHFHFLHLPRHRFRLHHYY